MLAPLCTEEAADLSALICDKINRPTPSPNEPITTALARGHQQLDGQYPQRAHHCGGGSCCPTREVITIFIICFVYYFLFYANPLHSSIPPPLNPHNRRVDDCVTGEEEVLIEGVGVEVEVEAEKVAEDVGVGQKK